MSVYIVISILLSSIKLNTIVYLVNKLCTEVLVETDTLAKERVIMNLKRKKLIIDDIILIRILF